MSFIARRSTWPQWYCGLWLLAGWRFIVWCHSMLAIHIQANRYSCSVDSLLLETAIESGQQEGVCTLLIYFNLSARDKWQDEFAQTRPGTAMTMYLISAELHTRNWVGISLIVFNISWCHHPSLVLCGMWFYDYVLLGYWYCKWLSLAGWQFIVLCHSMLALHSRKYMFVFSWCIIAWVSHGGLWRAGWQVKRGICVIEYINMPWQWCAW